LFEGSGYFHLVNLSSLHSTCIPSLPQNSHKARVDFPVELNLTQLARIAPLIESGGVDDEFEQHFRSAARFYGQGLRAWERDPEIAYLNLITCGEILSNFSGAASQLSLDDDTLKLLNRIRTGLPDGARVVAKLSKKLLSVKRRFVRTVLEHISDDFFDRSEALHDHGKLRQDDFERRVGAAYDLRSVHLHSGASFGVWVSRIAMSGNEEIQAGAPVVNNKDLGKALKWAPTLFGLERIIRVCLLRFAEKNGAYISAQR
jgi:Apea-like HEPN